MIRIENIIAENKKSEICEGILRSLPVWFGINESIIEYTNDVRQMPFYAACEGDKPVGFIAIKNHNYYTAEIYVMGVLEKYHRQGVGKSLIEQCEKYCAENNKVFLTVKTLDESRGYEPYDRTRSFYLNMGFAPLEVFPLLWDESNPCLFLAKYLDR